MRRAHLMAVAAVVLLAATACGSGAGSNASGGSSDQAVAAGDAGNTVHLPKSYKFEPSTIEIEAGEEVTWINEDDFPHTVRLLEEKGVDKKLAVGESTAISFPKAGTYRYDCSLHPTQMKGQVVVNDPAEDSSA